MYFLTSTVRNSSTHAPIPPSLCSVPNLHTLHALRYYSPPWTNVQSGASVGVWWTDLDTTNVLAPDVNQVFDCYFYTVSVNEDQHPFYFEHDFQYVRACQASQTFSILLVFLGLLSIVTAFLGLRRLTNWVTLTICTLTSPPSPFSTM